MSWWVMAMNWFAICILYFDEIWNHDEIFKHSWCKWMQALHMKVNWLKHSAPYARVKSGLFLGWPRAVKGSVYLYATKLYQGTKTHCRYRKLCAEDYVLNLILVSLLLLPSIDKTFILSRTPSSYIPLDKFSSITGSSVWKGRKFP